MAGTKKFNRRPELYNRSNEHDLLPLAKEEGIPIHIDRKGYIYARGFVDTNDELEFYVNNGALHCAHREGKQTNYSIHHSVSSVPQYTFSQTFYDVLYQSFQNFVFQSLFEN